MQAGLGKGFGKGPMRLGPGKGQGKQCGQRALAWLGKGPGKAECGQGAQAELGKGFGKGPRGPPEAFPGASRFPQAVWNPFAAFRGAFRGLSRAPGPCNCPSALARKRRSFALQVFPHCSFSFPAPFPRLLAIMLALLKPFPAAAFPFPGLSRAFLRLCLRSSSLSPLQLFLSRAFPAFPGHLSLIFF